MDTKTTSKADLLSELASQEDQFDVDLMACGCRYIGIAATSLSISELSKLYKLGDHELEDLLEAIIKEIKVTPNLVEAVVNEGKVTPQKVNQIAAKIFRDKKK